MIDTLSPILIGIDKPIAQFATDFFVPGKPHIHPNLPRVVLQTSCEVLTVPATFQQDSKIPLLYLRAGSIVADMVRWGFENKKTGEQRHFRQADVRPIGYPGLCPASFIDLPLAPGRGGHNEVVQLRPAAGHNLYVGCFYYPDQLGIAGSVTPILCKAGADLAEYVEWQPLLIRIDCVPTQENFEFLMRRDHGRLQKALPRRTTCGENFSVEVLTGG